jgi:hypothetical protein
MIVFDPAQGADPSGKGERPDRPSDLTHPTLVKSNMVGRRKLVLEWGETPQRGMGRPCGA